MRGVANGTEALEIALTAVNPVPRKIATVANAGMYSTAAIFQADRATICRCRSGLDDDGLKALAKSLTSDTGDYRDAFFIKWRISLAILEVANRAGIPVIEDCALAHGAIVAGKRAGSWGVAGCFSFYPTKNLGVLGDAGAIVTTDPAIADRMRSLRQYGWTTKYRSSIPAGRNSRLDELQAAYWFAKLAHLDTWKSAPKRDFFPVLRGFSEFSVDYSNSLWKRLCRALVCGSGLPIVRRSRQLWQMLA